MYYYYYDNESGELRSDSANYYAQLPPQISVLEKAERVDVREWMWDAGARDFVERPASRRLRPGQFLERLTQAERMAYYQSQTTNAEIVRRAFDGAKELGAIDLDDPATGQILDLLVTDGVITTERKTEILS